MDNEAAVQQSGVSKPGYREHYNVNPSIAAGNVVDDNGNPTGGDVILSVPTDQEGVLHPVLQIEWQNGPRGQEGTDELLPPNGAFVEDVIWAALQRLEFFNEGKYRDRANSLAITHLEGALQALKDRQLERSYRGVEGKHEV